MIDTRSRCGSYENVARYTTSSSSGIAPRRSTGDGYVRHVWPSGLVARKSASVVHDPATFPLNIAQYSPSDAIHCTSMCHGKSPGCEIDTATGADHDRPSAERRSSTLVLDAPHPVPPAFTVHISQSDAARRTTVGEMPLWFGALTTTRDGPHCTPSADCVSMISFSAPTWR